MNLVRLGRIVRTLRRRRGWRQLDLAVAAVCSQQAVSLIERGQANRLSMRTLQRVVAVLEADVDLVVRWRGGQVETLLDEGHAWLSGAIADLMDASGWIVRLEVTYGVGREVGSIDLLGFHSSTGTLLVVEVKTELLSAEATMRKLDEKARLAKHVALERFAWRGGDIGRLLVLPATSTARAAVERHAAWFGRAAPQRGWSVRRWLARPTGSMAGILFLQATKQVGDARPITSRRRIRARGTPSIRT